ncbi:MAG TPA: HNH endonuclease [Acidocella sp.]|jgi:hypothetical protein|nr:HNH endonuclease [Acidocella sp.]
MQTSAEDALTLPPAVADDLRKLAADRGADGSTVERFLDKVRLGTDSDTAENESAEAQAAFLRNLRGDSADHQPDGDGVPPTEDLGHCLIWTRGKSGNGYGAFKLDGKMQRAHRASYEIFRGPIPEGFVVRHRCDVPLCVNPEHLELGTSAENVKDRDARGRRGIPSADLTDSVKATVVEWNANGMTQQEIAYRLSVSRSTIEKVCRDDRKRAKQTHD